MAKKIMENDGQVYVQKKLDGCLKNTLIAIIAIIAFAGIFNALGGNKEKNVPKNIQQTVVITSTSETKIKLKKEDISSSSELQSEANIPKEFKNALNKAEIYAKRMNLSKKSVYKQLTSDYGEKFSVEAAQYAIDNLQNVDWKKNALNKAESYSSTLYLSKKGIYKQLTSEHAEKFTAEEAQYAIDNLKADYNQNALENAKTYQATMHLSVDSIRDHLTSENGEQFTPEEAEYAIQHLED